LHSCTNEIRDCTVLEVFYTLAVIAIPTSQQIKSFPLINLASDERPKEREECTIHSCTNEIRGFTVLEVFYISSCDRNSNIASNPFGSQSRLCRYREPVLPSAEGKGWCCAIHIGRELNQEMLHLMGMVRDLKKLLYIYQACVFQKLKPYTFINLTSGQRPKERDEGTLKTYTEN
jgi:hypothetical protein